MSWHAVAIEVLLNKLAVDPSQGLSRDEAQARLDEHGPNVLEVEEGPSAWKILLSQFTDVLIIILLIATILSALVGELFDAGLILSIVIFSAGLGFVQEYRAERAVEALREMLSPTATVVRGGEELEVSAREVVPGDVLLLEAGDRVAGDARVLDSHDLKVDEAALTGESVPVAKQPETLAEDTQVADRHNMLFMGTAVVYGRSRAVVVATGMDTEFGRIAKDVGTAEEVKTPLERRTAEIGKWLGTLSLGIVLLVIVLGIGRQLWGSRGLSLEFAISLAMFSVSLAVAAVPEALAGIVTGTLAVGMRRMARQNALVRRMPAVEALGSITVICADKTGTITRGEMTVRKIYTGDGNVEVTGVGYAPEGAFEPADAGERLSQLLKAGLLCNDADLTQEEASWRIHGDPTEGALVVLAAKAGLQIHDLRSSHPRIDEVPFSSERKRMTTVHHTPEGGNMAFMKGAAEVVVERCDAELKANSPVPLDETRRRAIAETAEQMAAEGLRVLALAYRGVEQASGSSEELERAMTFLGLVGMIDPARDESIEAVKACRAVDIRPVMITGDHKLTAVAVAKEVGIFQEGDEALTGAELEALSDQDFAQRVARVSVYARVSPADKIKIVRAWKQRGDIVAMTGDGVNDAPALKHADVGVAMGITGTEVAKEAADMVLADDNFATILKAVEMGRWIYDDIQKYLTYLVSANLVEVVVIAGIVLYKGAEYLPLLPAAILYINLVTDGLPAIALGFSPPEPDVMQRPPRDPQESVFSLEVKAFMLIAVAFTPVFFWSFLRGETLVEGRTDLFFLFLLFELIFVFNLRSLRYSLLQVPPHGWLVAAVAGSLVVTAGVMALPQVREAFGIAIPDLAEIQIVLAAAVAVTILSELVKITLRRRQESLVTRALQARRR
ncbi:MAG TPA: cation-translocating P-type ATPase [Alphaproteobacteria bacterium]|nr:cation-translocating P-type ATPase [Alphaproteobacteria bacterium]